MSLSKISKDISNDIEALKQEYKESKRLEKASGRGVSKFLSSKQKEQRLSKAEQREKRHRAIEQGVNNMLHDQMALVE